MNTCSRKCWEGEQTCLSGKPYWSLSQDIAETFALTGILPRLNAREFHQSCVGWGGGGGGCMGHCRMPLHKGETVIPCG